LRNGRVYTVPVVWGTPAAYKRTSGDVTLEEAVREKDALLLFSGWWFDPQRPRPYLVPEVASTGSIKVILSGEEFHWQQEFPVGRLAEESRPVERGESDARQETLIDLLPEQHMWNPRRPGPRPAE
jgi:hypothetical protein